MSKVIQLTGVKVITENVLCMTTKSTFSHESCYVWTSGEIPGASKQIPDPLRDPVTSMS